MSATRPHPPPALNAAAVVTVVVCLFPVYWMVATAFTPTRDIQSDSPGSSRRAGRSTTSAPLSRRGFGLFCATHPRHAERRLLALVIALGAAYASPDEVKGAGSHAHGLHRPDAPWESLIIRCTSSPGHRHARPAADLTLVYFMIRCLHHHRPARLIGTIPPELEDRPRSTLHPLGAFRHIAFPLLAPA